MNTPTKNAMTVAEAFCFYVITLCFGFFGYIVVMSYNTRFTLPTEAGMIMTAVISLATGTCGYIIGSNSASKRKDDLISKAMDTVPAQSVQTTVVTQTLNWLGTFESEPVNPKLNDAYVNSIKLKNFYWNGTAWEITTQSPV